MQYMITFALTTRDYEARIARFLETGAPPPSGVTMPLIDFEVHAVLESTKVAEVLSSM